MHLRLWWSAAVLLWCGEAAKLHGRKSTLARGDDADQEVVVPVVPPSSKHILLGPCGNDPCDGSTPTVTISDDKGTRLKGSKFTAPLIDTGATKEDRQIFNELVKYRRTIDAINARRDDRVQTEVSQLLTSARNELYQRDALRDQMDKQRVKAENEIRIFENLNEDYDEHDATAKKLVSSATTALHSFSIGDDPPDASVLSDLTQQVQVVRKHSQDSAAPKLKTSFRHTDEVDETTETPDESENEAESDSDDAESTSDAKDDSDAKDSDAKDSDSNTDDQESEAESAET
eukprot:CAMPEP_0195524914 /NCGR_PEP_ID=MMETSP0794_2-20130614/25027_1 /TAXON_ID=515487 /ORGANISM="Stephanopyxis turris, Strain CCMP 815" /LENGTH=288 /DNA_ID=CAMNT_0040655239 /DNA_START=147 /DNA_END=1010 /DNA_ORIENTATION=+